MMAGAAVTFTVNENSAVEFIEGLVEGIIDGDHLDEIHKCIQDGEGVADQVVKIIEEFSKGDEEDIIKGIEDTMALVKDLPNEVAECKEINGDVTKVVNKVQSIIDNPDQIEENILKNVIKIE